MVSKRLPAREVARHAPGNGFWIDHAVVIDDDLSWLEGAERLTLWNVKLPVGFLARLPRLWWLDLRGGTAADIHIVRGAMNLRFLSVNQIRGLSDLSEIALLAGLRLLSIYGLPQVSTLPSLGRLAKLQRAEVGQMKGLLSLNAILDAPRLQELLLVRTVNVTDSDMVRIRNHQTLKEFHWVAEDVPDRIWQPVLAELDMPRTRSLLPEEWFKSHAVVRHSGDT